MRSLFHNPGWLATLAAVVALLLCMAVQLSSARGRAGVTHTAPSAPVVAGAQGGLGSGSFVMDGDWFYILHGSKFYKVQKSTMSVFQTVDLN